MKIRNRAQIFVDSFVALLVAGLVSLLVAGAAGAAPADDELRLDKVESYPLAADGRVSLDNVNGDVVVEVWDQAEVRIEAVIRARDQERLDDVEIAVDADERHVHVETRYRDEHRGWFRERHDPASVDYTLWIPRDAELSGVDLVNGSLDLRGLEGRVEADTVNGSIQAEGLTGDVDLSTVNGGLVIELAALDPGRSVSLEAVNGTIELIVPRNADADISAESVHGRISNDFGFDVHEGEFVGRDMRGSVGRGGARVSLETVNGTIEVRSR